MELKSCPFCGSDARKAIRKGTRGHTGAYYREWIYCTNRKCSIQGPTTKRPEQNSALLWNNRTTAKDADNG